MKILYFPVIRMGFLLLGIAMAGVSCAHKVNYHLTDAEKWTGPTIKKTVQVVDFKDDAPQDEKVSFRMGKSIYRMNGRTGYPEEGDLSAPVSDMIGRHLEHSGLFEEVYYGAKPLPEGASADYVLDGTIYDYHGLGKMNRTSESLVMMGSSFLNLPGYALAMLATKKNTSDVQSNVRLNDLSLKNSRRNVWSMESVVSTTKGKDYFVNGDNKGVFEMADKGLREAVNYVIDDIGQSQTGVRPKKLERDDPKTFSEKILNTRIINNTETTTTGTNGRGTVTTRGEGYVDPAEAITEDTTTAKVRQPFRGNPGR